MLATLFTIALFGAPLTAAPAAAPPPPVTSRLHVRPETKIARTILDDARRRSPTIADMLDRIEASDVILFLDLQYDQPTAGQTRLFSASPLARFVRVIVDLSLPFDRRTEIIAHELQHVLEIVADPTVRDERGMRELFERIGWTVGLRAFETVEARAIEGVVRREMGGKKDSRSQPAGITSPRR
jgi:hypothetical protein